MLILALETTSEICSVAVADEAGVICERAFRHRMKLSQRLMGDLAAVLADAGVHPEDLEGIGVSLGPGSFTGVRVGVTVAKVMADVLTVPLAGISTLEILAWPHRALGDATLVPVVRSRAGVVCMAFFAGGTHLKPIRNWGLYTMEEAAEALRGIGSVLLCGEYAPKLAQALHEMFGLHLPATDGDPPRAGVVAALAAQRLKERSADDPMTLTPIYAAPPPIHMKP